MKKIILSLAFLVLVYTLGLMFNTAEAQSKKNPSRVTEISVSAPTMFVEYKGVILEFYDREGQQDGIQIARIEDERKGLDPRDPEMTFIHLPEMSERAYKFAESLQEAAQEADGYKVIKMKWTELMQNRRTKYN